MSLNDPAVVREEYSTEAGLRGRASAYEHVEGPDANDLALAAVVEASPARVLEAGCGWGGFSQRMIEEHGLDVRAVDLSPRMVELARERGVDARVADVQELPFADAAFDCAVANWMLYHVPDVDRGVAELARVLETGGRLVAVTNGIEHLHEVYELLGAERTLSPFSAENGEEILRRSFATVERRDSSGWVTFADRDAVQRYVDSARVLRRQVEVVPPFDGPLRVRRAPCVFVATT